MNTQLFFHNTQFHVVHCNGKHWLTSSEIAQALNYKSEDAVTKIYNRNTDEFSQGMTETVKVGVSGNLQKEIRIFSLRGAHLIAMFARTPVAKEFRKWVLDILDKEINNNAQPSHKPVTLNTDEQRALRKFIATISDHFHYSQCWSYGLWYALRRVTNTPSPEKFTVADIPQLELECKRIYRITSRLSNIIIKAEQRVLQQLIRKGDESETILGEIEIMLEKETDDVSTLFNALLDKYQEREVKEFRLTE